ncbi:GerAB/ArcD/ProY family transporter [Jeotgalibacillus terrae]|uniref:GerAB/ArcD/ProY family transporter n=1 Tax=Jeotgalibacillus terrae TaxID=587735 RepID=A0ABW5ZKJ3_9BACL|nr:GerAB/ArcD/ProY family transporter [Jeotgalibacillus terrae]MBM7577355.1 spore germination protein (amino acid permease) [Jeotgalibacillus terrae]
MQKNSITGWQFCFLTLQTQMGMSALSMPSLIANKAGQDAWISMILGGLIVQVIILMYMWLIVRCKNSSYFDFLAIVFGKVIGKFLLLLTILYIIFIMILVTASYQQLITDWINIYTPGWIIVLLLLIPSLYLSIDSISLIARFSMLISFLIPVLLIVVLFVYAEPQFFYLLPIGSEGLDSIIKGVIPAIAALSGFEMILFTSHFLKGNKLAGLKKGMIGSGLVTLIYIYLIISVQIFFYIDELKIVPYPVLYIMKALSLMIIDRIDILFLTFWIIISTAVCVNYLFVAGISMQSLFNLQAHRHMIMVTITSIMIFIGSIFIDSKIEITEIQNQLFEVGVGLVVLIPFLTLIFSLITKRLGNN